MEASSSCSSSSFFFLSVVVVVGGSSRSVFVSHRRSCCRRRRLSAAALFPLPCPRKGPPHGEPVPVDHDRGLDAPDPPERGDGVGDGSRGKRFRGDHFFSFFGVEVGRSFERKKKRKKTFSSFLFSLPHHQRRLHPFAHHHGTRHLLRLPLPEQPLDQTQRELEGRPGPAGCDDAAVDDDPRFLL